jgi:putative transposase
MLRPSLQIRLSSKDRQQLQDHLRGGVQPVRSVLRALALLQMADGVSASQIAQFVPLTAQAIRNLGANENFSLAPKIRKVAHRFEQGGLDRALFDKPRPGAAALLDAAQQQRIIAMVCSEPPTGRSHWTVRLVAEEGVKRRLVPRVGREAIRVMLLSHDLKPWREKNVVRSGTE